jgi:hypothetical protein
MATYDYRKRLLDELKRYLDNGSMPKMALEHLDEVYKLLFSIIKKDAQTPELRAEMTAELTKAYGDIIRELTEKLKIYASSIV